jgi:hypothetical protein
MASPKKYHPTVKAVFEWAKGELEHVGRITGVEDPDLQYSYAMSTVNGMAHLKDAIDELASDGKYEHHHEDLLRLRGQVIRTMKHLIKDYDLDLNTIKAFNTKKVLSDLSYLKGGRRRKTRRNRK